MKKILSTIASFLLFTTCLGVSFQRMKLNHDIDVRSMDAIANNITKTNSTLMIGTDDASMANIPSQKLYNVDGIVFDVYEDGYVKFFFNDIDESTNPLDKIIVNGRTLSQHVRDLIADEVSEISRGFGEQTTNISRQVSLDSVGERVYNPLWGKKLAVIGDSLISSPTIETSYPYYIAQRNNMTLVHKGRSGEMLCKDRTNELGQVTHYSTINSYTNNIPSDADYILCQIGANDSAMWSQGIDENVADTNMTLTTFKGCWNNLLIGLKKNYPNAKIGMILANNWIENLGKKTEDTIPEEVEKSRRQMTQWQKIQCQKLNIPVFDPVEDTRWFMYHYSSYPASDSSVDIDSLDLDWYDRVKREIGTDMAHWKSTDSSFIFQTKYMVDKQHTTETGNLLLSFFYEHWMKVVLSID